MIEATRELTTFDDYVEHLSAEGFKQVKKSENEMSKTVTFRKFEDGEAKEAIIKQIGSHISIKKTVNGIPV